jgi:hypothetical protein
MPFNCDVCGEEVSYSEKSFELRNLRRMMQFCEVFPDVEIVVTMSRQLSWFQLFKMNFQNNNGFSVC